MASKPKRKRSSPNSYNVPEDPPEVVAEKCVRLARALAGARHAVVFTGAGISTAANIPDYRGPEGIWTLLKSGRPVRPFDVLRAEPTLTHMALVELVQRDVVKYIVSQNCDGLHLRSGLPRDRLSELHGNIYAEVCKKCSPSRVVFRPFDVTRRGAGTGPNRTATTTGCKCEQQPERAAAAATPAYGPDAENAKPAPEASAASSCSAGAELKLEQSCSLPPAGALTPPSEHTQSSSDSGFTAVASPSPLHPAAPPPDEQQLQLEHKLQRPPVAPPPPPKQQQQQQQPESKSLSLQQCLARAFSLPPATGPALATDIEEPTKPEAEAAADDDEAEAEAEAEVKSGDASSAAARPARGRKCEACGSFLLPTIVHFGRRIPLGSPLHYYERALANAQNADLILCLGSSLQILKHYKPLWSMNRSPRLRPRLFIVNLQRTPKDPFAELLLHARCDDVLRCLCQLLNVPITSFSPAIDPLPSIVDQSFVFANEADPSLKRINSRRSRSRSSSSSSSASSESSSSDDDSASSSEASDDIVDLCSSSSTSGSAESDESASSPSGEDELPLASLRGKQSLGDPPPAVGRCDEAHSPPSLWLPSLGEQPPTKLTLRRSSPHGCYTVFMGHPTSDSAASSAPKSVLVPPAVLTDVTIRAALAAAESASAAATPAPSPKVEQNVDDVVSVSVQIEPEAPVVAGEPRAPFSQEVAPGAQHSAGAAPAEGSVGGGAKPIDAITSAVSTSSSSTPQFPEIPRWCFAHHDLYVRYSRKRTIALRRSDPHPRRQPSKAERNARSRPACGATASTAAAVAEADAPPTPTCNLMPVAAAECT